MGTFISAFFVYFSVSDLLLVNDKTPTPSTIFFIYFICPSGPYRSDKSISNPKNAHKTEITEFRS